MLIPEPLPDELAYSHVGRIGYLNGLPSIVLTEQALRREVRLKQSDAPWLSYVAKVSGFSEEEYATRHTIGPMMKAVHRMTTNGIGLSPTQLVLRRFGVITKCSDGHFCSQCVEDDLRQYGVAYWHRIHCLPGVGWCAKHGLRLKLDKRPHCFKFSPERFDDGKDHPVAQKGNPLIARYVSIMQGLLLGAKSVLLQDARRALVEHMAIWFQNAPASSGQALKLKLIPALPPPWDFLRLGHIAQHELATLDRAADDVFRQASAFDVGAYGLALAIAFRTADDAMRFHADIGPAAPWERHYEGVVDDSFWRRQRRGCLPEPIAE